MKTFATYALAAATLSLAACNDRAAGDPAPDNSEPAEAAAVMTDSDKRQARAQCEIAAVAQGGTAEQARALCECTIDKVAEGRTVEEFAAVPEDEANAALEQCAAETGIS